jgi:alpha-beta hydrolase superfamily lysophospholipase
MSIDTTILVTIAALAAPAAASAQAAAALGAEEVRFRAADGTTVYGDLHHARNGTAGPVIVLFHQAGSNARGEYQDIVPRLLENGYSVLAVDLRLGGSRYGSENRTVTAGRLPDSNAYCSAYPDLTAAWDYLVERGFTGPRFAWGSSYSAALVIRLAAERASGMAGVLAFSPASGEPMAGCRPEQHIDGLAVPALILRPQAEADMASVTTQIERFRAAGKQVHVARPGTHGSSMLVAARVDGDTEATWTVVLEFLRTHASSQPLEREP